MCLITYPLLASCAGIWQGTVVAVKVMLLPASLTRSEQQQHMAVMEAAISSAMSHPNIVQVGGGEDVSVCFYVQQRGCVLASEASAAAAHVALSTWYGYCQ